MSEAIYQAYDQTAAVLATATTDREHAELVGRRVAESDRGPGYVLIRGQNHWALRLNPDRSTTELAGEEIPAKIRQANAR
jgi:hypothetical protein